MILYIRQNTGMRQCAFHKAAVMELVSSARVLECCNMLQPLAKWNKWGEWKNTLSMMTKLELRQARSLQHDQFMASGRPPSPASPAAPSPGLRPFAGGLGLGHDNNLYHVPHKLRSHRLRYLIRYYIELYRSNMIQSCPSFFSPQHLSIIHV